MIKKMAPAPTTNKEFIASSGNARIREEDRSNDGIFGSMLHSAQENEMTKKKLKKKGKPENGASVKGKVAAEERVTNNKTKQEKVSEAAKLNSTENKNTKNSNTKEVSVSNKKAEQ